MRYDAFLYSVFSRTQIFFLMTDFIKNQQFSWKFAFRLLFIKKDRKIFPGIEKIWRFLSQRENKMRVPKFDPENPKNSKNFFLIKFLILNSWLFTEEKVLWRPFLKTHGFSKKAFIRKWHYIWKYNWNLL